jgi:predicted nucleotidyltransferase
MQQATATTDADAIKPVLARRPWLRLALVFGSVAKGSASAHSDVDVAVLADAPLSAEQHLALVGDLAEATGRAVDLVDLRTAGEPLLGEILVHGRRLLGSDQAFGDLLSRHLLDAADFLPCAERIVEQRRRAWIGS